MYMTYFYDIGMNIMQFQTKDKYNYLTHILKPTLMEINLKQKKRIYI